MFFCTRRICSDYTRNIWLLFSRADYVIVHEYVILVHTCDVLEDAPLFVNVKKVMFLHKKICPRTRGPSSTRRRSCPVPYLLLRMAATCRNLPECCQYEADMCCDVTSMLRPVPGNSFCCTPWLGPRPGLGLGLSGP